MESYISWSRLAAASGLIGVTYTTGVDPVADTRAVMRYLRAHGSTHPEFMLPRRDGDGHDGVQADTGEEQCRGRAHKAA